ncbi:hypothetical protein GCM10017779_38550 [Streptomyces capillispiralis]|nr:hypothetical protein GCM10017779_38550 [Streptomyces capillispiralis]
MLAIASLATGFVVAAITPSHALGESVVGLGVDDTLETVDRTVAEDNTLAVDVDRDDRD